MPDEIEEIVPDPDENTEVLEDIDEVTEDVDELVAEVRALAATNESRHTQILSEVERCQTELTRLSTATLTAENPILTQILNQLIEMRVELTSLKLSADMRQSPRPRSDSETPIPEEVPVDDGPEATPDNRAENEGVPPRAKKNRFV